MSAQRLSPSSSSSSSSSSSPYKHLPTSNEGYAHLDYWQERYKNEAEESFDWFVAYPKIRDLILRHIRTCDSILNLGCGNSSMPMEMWADGFRDVTSVDYSSIVIEAMAGRTKEMEGLRWMVADIFHMEQTFLPGSFDVVIEKGTLDALLVSETDPWEYSGEAEAMLLGVLDRVSELLKPGGRFVSVTFCQPHFRLPFYADRRFGWSVEVETIGSNFHYFCYVLTKGGELSESDERHRTKYLQRKEEKARKLQGIRLGRGGAAAGDDDDDDEDEDYLLKVEGF